VILTDREIQIALSTHQIIIDPEPAKVAYSSTSVDLTLDKHVALFDTGKEYVRKVIDPTHVDFDVEEALKEITKPFEIDARRGYDLPGETFILGWSAEYIKIPVESRMAARVEGKSSLARLGIGIHVTAPTIHAGFDGQIRLEIINHGYFAVALKPGMRICQLVFEQALGTPVKGYEGRFSGQRAT
jgi:dCTP deaminase